MDITNLPRNLPPNIKRLGSQAFRIRYPRLTEPVIVEAYGRPIGFWQPFVPYRPEPSEPPAEQPVRRERRRK